MATRSQQGESGPNPDLPEKDVWTVEQTGVDRAAKWVGDRRVHERLDGLRQQLEIVLSPLDRLLVDGRGVRSVLNALFGIAYIAPSEAAQRALDVDRGVTWPPSPSEWVALNARRPLVRAVLRTEAQRLAALRVEIDPAWEGDLITLAELALLDVDLEMPATELATELQPPSAGGFTSDGKWAHLPIGTPARSRRSFDQLREKRGRFVTGQPPPQPGAPRGKKYRAPESDRRAERVAYQEALVEELLDKAPDASPRAVLATWGMSARTSGGWLRERWPGIERPSESTLRRRFRAARAKKSRQEQCAQHF